MYWAGADAYWGKLSVVAAIQNAIFRFTSAMCKAFSYSSIMVKGVSTESKMVKSISIKSIMEP